VKGIVCSAIATSCGEAEGVPRAGVRAASRLRLRAPHIVGALACALAWLLPAGTLRAAEGDGLHATPSVYWQDGDHRLDLGVEFRWRPEWWDATQGSTDGIQGLRTRVHAQYDFRKLVTAFAEFQDARVLHMGADASGAAQLYQRFSESPTDSATSGQDIRQGWLEVRPLQGLAIRGGRMDVNLGTQTPAAEANWRYLQLWRAALRLVGTVVWTNGERSNDGGSLAYETDAYHLFVFGANPTTGVFDIHKAYEHQSNLVHGGVQLTAKRGTWLPNTEVRTFFLGYRDGRPAREAGSNDGQNVVTTGAMDIDIYTFGFSSIGVYPLGAGLADLFVWGAGQLGEFNGRDHAAGAGIFEAGYRLPELPAKPWLRLGINVASGGDTSGDHTTFHNLLPTNHPYYGFADQLAFQNLMDLFGQLKLQPHEKVGLNLMLHHFRLLNAKDAQYFGSGAFSKQGTKAGAFGYGGVPASTHGFNHDVGTELDVVIDWKLHPHAALQGGYAYLWGGDVFKAKTRTTTSDRDVQFGYLQLSLSY